MYFKELDKKLESLNIKETFYRLNEFKYYNDDILLVEEINNQWHVSFLERGEKQAIAVFDYEFHAVNYIYGSILIQLEQSYKAKLKIEFNIV